MGEASSPMSGDDLGETVNELLALLEWLVATADLPRRHSTGGGGISGIGGERKVRFLICRTGEGKGDGDASAESSSRDALPLFLHMRVVEHQGEVFRTGRSSSTVRFSSCKTLFRIG